MDKAGVVILIQLLQTLRDLTVQMEQADVERDVERCMQLKKEADALSVKIDSIL